VAKPGPRRTQAQGGRGEATRRRIVEAALETLKEGGFAGASARAIARRGGFNQALIFYHFGSVDEALLAALDETSGRRMERYRAALEGVGSLPDLLAVAAEIYREDLAAGHITVLAEMIAGASAHPDLGPRIVERIEPWVAFTEEAIGRVLNGSPLAAFIPVRDVAFAIVALYLGLELLTHLQGDGSRTESLLALARSAAPMAAGLLAGPAPIDRTR
jgi:AcrR family transcriptional regulator